MDRTSLTEEKIMDTIHLDRGRNKHAGADRVRHVLLGICLVLGPALIAIASFLSPVVDWENTREVIATAASQSTLWQAAGVIELVGAMLLVPAVIAAAELIRSRYPGLALAIVILVSTSAMVIVGAIFFGLVFASAAGLDEAAIAEFIAAGESLGSMALLTPLFFGGLIGYLLLAFGLWRTRATPRWVPALFVVALGATFFTPIGAATGIANLGWAAASAGMAWAYLVGEEDPTPTIVQREKALVS
jgi:hypothetical protein